MKYLYIDFHFETDESEIKIRHTDQIYVNYKTGY